MLFRFARWCQDATDRARNSRRITVSTTSSINRARIHASTTTDAMKRPMELFALAQVAAPVIDQDDVELTTWHGTMKMRSVGSDRLTGGASGQ